MTQLSPLRSRLNDLRRRRQAVRLGTGYAAIALAVLWCLAALFLVDWLLEMNKPQRIVAILACLGVIVWAARRYALPWLGQHESELDIALLVEKQQRIDSDLVAAIQFESAEAPRWGSPQLEQAVIGYVAEFGKSWNVLEGFSRQELVRRGGALIATVVLLALAIAIFPKHAGAFFNRMLLGSAHYPTATVLDKVLVNGREVEPFSSSPLTVKVPYSRPIKFEVQTSGDLPDSGRVNLVSNAGGSQTSVDLTRASGAAESSALYSGQLPKAIDSVSYQLYLGDAWTEPAEIQVIELPNIDVHLTATAPSYARSSAEKESDNAPGSRQISVIEGSQIDLRLTCANKRLSEATLAIDGTKYPLKPELSSSETAGDDAQQQGHRWKLVTTQTPFVRVEKPLRYEIQVEDEDGLQLEQPIQGFIRIKADQKPRVTADVITHVVLPTATPQIKFRAFDDYGIKQVLAHLEIAGDGVTAEKTAAEEITTDGITASATPAEPPQPIRIWPAKNAGDDTASQPTVSGAYKLNLAPLGLKKGSELKVTLEAIDERGAAAGQSGRSETIVFQVTDESGILAAISESDQRSARQLDDIIKRQLGVGETK
jgi:hypothetical protein